MLTGGIGRVSPGHLGPLVVSGAPGAAAKTDRPAAMAVGKSISHKKKPTMQESSGYDDHRQKLDQDIGPQIANPGFLCKIPYGKNRTPATGSGTQGIEPNRGETNATVTIESDDMVAITMGFRS